MSEEINWREELLESANFNGKQERILREPPVSYCQSSFQEFNKKVREVEE